MINMGMKQLAINYDPSNVLMLMLCLILLLQIFISPSYIIITFAICIFCIIKKYKLTCAILILIVYLLKCIFILKNTSNNDVSSVKNYNDCVNLQNKTENAKPSSKQVNLENITIDSKNNNEEKLDKNNKIEEKENLCENNNANSDDVTKKKQENIKMDIFGKENFSAKKNSHTKNNEIYYNSYDNIEDKENDINSYQHIKQNSEDEHDSEDDKNLLNKQFENSVEYYSSLNNKTNYFDQFHQFNDYEFEESKSTKEKNNNNDKNLIKINQIKSEQSTLVQIYPKEESDKEITYCMEISLPHQNSEHVFVVKKINYVVC